MENSKYYTPQIEEFCVGFEYEINQGKISGWEKENVSLNTDLSAINFHLTNNDIRVKYLDKEDVLDLGFSKDKKYYEKSVLGNSEFIKIEDYHKDNGENIFKIKTYWDYNLSERENLVRVFKGKRYDYPYKEIFCGNIKNKNELKKLLKQLEICI